MYIVPHVSMYVHTPTLIGVCVCVVQYTQPQWEVAGVPFVGNSVQ